MKTRIISAAILLPLLLIILIVLPKVFTAILFGAMSAIAVYELLVETKMITNVRLAYYAMVPAFVVSLWSFYGAKEAYFLIIVLIFYIVLFFDMMLDSKHTDFQQLALSMVAGLLIPYMLTSVVRIFSGTQGRYLVYIPFVATMMSDSGAYFVGRKYGKHKMAPHVSPNKTIEGMVGGIIAAVIGMIIYCLIMHFAFGFRTNYGYALVYGTLGALAGVFGDLSFSVIKRQTGIKDFGKVIPGHGGILDRFDSLIVVGPLMELFITILPMAVR